MKDPKNNELEQEDDFDSYEQHEQDLMWAEISAQMAEDYIWG